jgi:hypothetical protein
MNVSFDHRQMDGQDTSKERLYKLQLCYNYSFENKF